MTDVNLMALKLSPVPDAIESQVGDEIVLLHLTKGLYFGIDAIGAIIWKRLKEGAQAADIFNSLLAEYDVAPEVLESDMRKFLSDLIANDLVRVHQAA